MELIRWRTCYSSTRKSLKEDGKGDGGESWSDSRLWRQSKQNLLVDYMWLGRGKEMWKKHWGFQPEVGKLWEEQVLERTQKSVLGQVKFEIPIKLPSEDTNCDVSYTSLEPRGEFGLRCTWKPNLSPAFQYPLQVGSTWLSQHHQLLGVKINLPVASLASLPSSSYIILTLTFVSGLTWPAKVVVIVMSKAT